MPWILFLLIALAGAGVVATVIAAISSERATKLNKALVHSLLEWANDTGCARSIALVASTTEAKVTEQHLLGALGRGCGLEDGVIIRISCIRRQLGGLSNSDIEAVLDRSWSALKMLDGAAFEEGLRTARASYLHEQR